MRLVTLAGRRSGVAAIGALVLAACTVGDPEGTSSTTARVVDNHLCGVLPAGLIVTVLPAAELAQRGTPLSAGMGQQAPRGNCTLAGPDGQALLWVVTDSARSAYADTLRDRDARQTEMFEREDSQGWAGRLGSAENDGGYAVLEDQDVIVSVTLHQWVEGRDPAGDAARVAQSALTALSPRR